MILEAATFAIQSGRAAAFEAAFKQAIAIIAGAKGFIALEMQRSVDVPDHYLLLVKWQTYDDHMVGFRESPSFIEWRRLLGPYFAAPPQVEHYELFATG